MFNMCLYCVYCFFFFFFPNRRQWENMRIEKRKKTSSKWLVFHSWSPPWSYSCVLRVSVTSVDTGGWKISKENIFLYWPLKAYSKPAVASPTTAQSIEEWECWKCISALGTSGSLLATGRHTSDWINSQKTWSWNVYFYTKHRWLVLSKWWPHW